MTSRARRVLVVVLAVVLVLGAASYGLWRTQRQVPVVVDAACPALLPGTSDALDDYADLVTWSGRTYVEVDDGPDWVLGDATGAVTCSIGEMENPKGWRLAPGAWPDGTATRLPRGTVLRPSGDRALVADEPGGPTLYCQTDGAQEPTC